MLFAILLCGNADPVAMPPTLAAAYYNTLTFSFWFWDPVNLVWVKRIA